PTTHKQPATDPTTNNQFKAEDLSVIIVGKEVTLPEIAYLSADHHHEETRSNLTELHRDPETKNPPTQPRHKRGPSVVDLAPTYNIADDLLQQKSNATYAQILQIPKQRRNLAQALKRPLITPVEETNLVDPKPSSRTTAAKCYVRVKKNPILAVLDSGAAVSIISKRLMNKLGLTIQEPSTAIVVTAN
ncbi:3997_t:CDS:2, partial [Cetraspora pellucida]